MATLKYRDPHTGVWFPLSGQAKTNNWDAAEIPGGADLNSFIVPGLYTQSQNVEAESGSNYPVDLAGALEVLTNYNGSMVWQRYRVYQQSGRPHWTYQRELYSGTWSGWAFMGPDPDLPDPGDTYRAADQSITSLTRGTELPSTVRVSVKNPHPVKRMLVRGINSAWASLLTGTGACYVDTEIVSGFTNAIPPISWRSDAPAYMAGNAESHMWLNPGVVGTLGVAAARSGTGVSPILRYIHSTVIPLRYE